MPFRGCCIRCRHRRLVCRWATSGLRDVGLALAAAFSLEKTSAMKAGRGFLADVLSIFVMSGLSQDDWVAC
jgi:hypothetical protein